MTFKLDRRTFLRGASLTALSGLAPLDANATMLPLLAPTRTPAAALPVGPKFNGGQSQVNLNFLQFGGDFPFLNCLKTAQSWNLSDNSGLPDPTRWIATAIQPPLLTGVFTPCFSCRLRLNVQEIM